MNATIDTEVQEFNIDGDLRALCEENVQAMKVLQSLGISSLIVFANFWDSPQEMREELTDMGILEPMISKDFQGCECYERIKCKGRGSQPPLGE